MKNCIAFAIAILIASASIAHAEFVIDDFGGAGPFFGTAATTSSTAGPDVDDFGNSYAGVTLAVSGSAGFDTASGNVSFNQFSFGDSLALTYDFNSVGDTTSLGFFAQNFRLDGLVSTPTAVFDIGFTATEANGDVGSFTLNSVSLDNTGDSLFFDLTNLGDVNVLNDLSTLEISFTTEANVVLGFSSFSLVATPEPTSLASLGSLACIGFVTSLRRRRKKIA